MCPFPKSRHGFTMLPLILFMFVIVGLISAGYMMLGPKVQLGKTVEMTKSLDSIANAVILWTASSRSLPTTLQTVFTGGNPLDPWGSNILYVFDNNLTNTATGGICGKTSTNLTANGTVNTAFVLISSAGDALQSVWSGAPPLSLTTTAYPANAAGTTATLVAGDLFKIVTLEELKTKAGCYGSTQGRLKILNNELPSVCAGSTTYPATLFPDGGVSGYTWALTSPAWLQINPTTGVITPQPSIISTPGTYQVSVQLADSHTPAANSVQKNLRLLVKSCSSTPPQLTNFDGFTAVAKRNGVAAISADKTTATLGGTAGRNGSSACIWYPQQIDLKDGFFRAYFEFQFASNDTSVKSDSFGDGFVITLMNGAFAPFTANTCSMVTNGIGYQGLRAGTDRSSYAVEFDTYPLINTTVNDPLAPGYFNHVAIINNTNVNHTRITNPNYPLTTICDGSKSGCYKNPSPTAPANWMEDTTTHKVRLEVLPGCNSTCSSCGVTGQTYALIKTWMECDTTGCTDTSQPLADASRLISQRCLPVPASMDKVVLGFTSGNGANTSQSLALSNFSASFPSSAPIATPTYRVWNNSGIPRYFRINNGTSTTTCSSVAVPDNNEITTALTRLQPGWALYTYSDNRCRNNRLNTTYANIYGPPSKDVNGDGCVQITTGGAAGVTDRSCPTAPAPVCSFTLSPVVVAHNSTVNLTWGITNGPADGIWSPLPGGSCSNFSSLSVGTCSSAPMTTPGPNQYFLTVSNVGGNSVCSATVHVGCQNYRVWNSTGARYDFRRPDGTCARINSGGEITNVAARLAPGQSVTRYATNNRTCSGVATGIITYNQAMNVDISANGGNGNCRVNYLIDDTVADR